MDQTRVARNCLTEESSEFEFHLEPNGCTSHAPSAAEHFEALGGRSTHNRHLSMDEEEACFYQGEGNPVDGGASVVDAHGFLDGEQFEDMVEEGTLHSPDDHSPRRDGSDVPEAHKNDSARVVKIQTSGFGKVVHNLLRQARDKVTFRELLDGCKQRVRDVVALGGEERSGRSGGGKDRRVSFRADSVAQAAEFRQVFQEFQQLARGLPVSPTPVEALLMQVTTGQGSIMHFEDALRLQQEDSEQRKKGKKGKQLPVSGGTQLAGLVLEKGAELQVENEQLKKKLKELQEAVSNANTRALKYEKDKKELQEIIGKKKLVIRKQRASFLCDLAVEKRKRSKLKMKHAVAIAQYARRLKHVVTTLTMHNSKLAKEADSSRKAKETRKKELEQQKAQEGSQPGRKAKRKRQPRDGEVLVEEGATQEGQRPVEGRPKAPKRRRKEAPLTDRGDPPVALGPNARLLTAYSTPGGLLHAAGIDPGFPSPATAAVGAQPPVATGVGLQSAVASEAPGPSSAELDSTLSTPSATPRTSAPEVPVEPRPAQQTVELPAANGTLKSKKRKAPQANGSAEPLRG